jgi:molybdopterin converting factor small subunit
MGRVTVHLWSGLRRLTDGADAVEVEASTVGTMLDALIATHPGVAPVIEAGVSVVIDGEMSTSLHHPVQANNEIYLMQRLKGG